jgi:hypothetical protein
MDQAEAEPLPLNNNQLSMEHRQLSETLYYVLAMLLKGRALRLLMSVGQGQGLEGWRTLVRHFEPESSGRLLGFLSAILNPELGINLPQAQTPERYPDLLTAWCNNLEQYHRQAPQRLGDEVLTAALISRSPAMVRDYLVLNANVLGTSFARNKQAALQFLLAKRSWGPGAFNNPAPKTPQPLHQQQQQAPTPMQVDGLERGRGRGRGAGRWRGKGGKGRTPSPSPSPVARGKGRGRWGAGAVQNPGGQRQQQGGQQ